MRNQTSGYGILPFLAVWAAAICVLAAVESAALTTTFVHHDQYRYFIETLTNPNLKSLCESDRQYLWLYKIGRPFTAEIECFIFRRVSFPSDLTCFRIAVVVLQGLGAAIVAVILRRCGLRWISGTALGIAIFLLPGEQNAVFMANFANVLTPILALTSRLALEVADRLRRAARLHGHLRFGLMAAAWLCLMTANHLYPGLAVCFFTASFAYMLLREHERGWALVTRDCLFFLSVAVPYYLLLKVWFEPHFAIGQQLPSNYVAALSPLALFASGIKVLLFIPAITNFWNIYPDLRISVLVIFILVLARLVTAKGGDDLVAKIGGKGHMKIVILLTLFAAANLVLLSSSAVLIHRALVAQAAILLLWSFASLVASISAFGRWPWERVEVPTACVIVGIAAFSSGTTISENVRASALERAYLRSAIAQASSAGFDNIVVVEPPRNGVGLNGRPIVSDEFNMPSSLGSSNLGSNLPEMVRVAMLELGRHDRPIVAGDCPIRSAGVADTSLSPSGQIQIHAPNGWFAVGTLRGDKIVLPLGLIGVLSPDRHTIVWDCGVTWMGEAGGPTGSWLSTIDPRPITVWRQQFTQTSPMPGALVIDMVKAAIPH